MGLHDFQVADLAFYMKTPRCLNLSDPGTGKTPSVCVWFYWLWTDKKVRSAWAMPLSLLKKNREEILRFTGFKPEDVIIVAGTKQQRTKQMAADAKVFLMGFDCFSTNWAELKANHPDLDALAVDEFHMGYGGDGSTRTQNFYLAMENITYFLGMTGTIINGRLSSAYPAIRVVSPQSYSSYEAFLLRHAVLDGYGKIRAWTGTKPIAEIFRRKAIRHSFEEIYGKEAKIVVNEQCTMHPAQRKAYEEFEETALLELEESFLEGSLPGVHLIRCRQLMEHPQTFGAPLDQIKLTGKEERLLVHLASIKETGKPLLIFSALVPSQERIVKICEEQGLRVGLINGNVSAKKRSQIDLAFQAGELDVVVASPATASVGFNWGHVDTVIFMSVDYMDSSFLQGYRRAMRGVRKTPLLIYVMEYENSVDQRIFKIVETKSALATEVDDSQVVVKLSADSVKPRKGARILKEDRKMTMSEFTAVK
jgi:ERCC4-related helicase